MWPGHCAVSGGGTGALTSAQAWLAQFATAARSQVSDFRPGGGTWAVAAVDPPSAIGGKLVGFNARPVPVPPAPQVAESRKNSSLTWQSRMPTSELAPVLTVTVTRFVPSSCGPQTLSISTVGCGTSQRTGGALAVTVRP